MRLVTLMRVRSRVDRLGSSRHPGPEQSRPHWQVPFPGRSAGDRPLLPWALGLRMFGPYFALGRDLQVATFAMGVVFMTGRPLLFAGPPRLDGLSHRGTRDGSGAVSGTGHFCAGHVIPVCLALTVRFVETAPLWLLCWAKSL